MLSITVVETNAQTLASESLLRAAPEKLAAAPLAAPDPDPTDKPYLASVIDDIDQPPANKGYEQNVTIDEVLRWTLENNPEILAARELVEQAKAAVSFSESGFKPTVESRMNIQDVHTDISGGADSGSTSKDVSLNISQPLFRGGSTIAAVDEALLALKAEKAALAAIEQQTLAEMAAAYMDVYRDQAVVALRRNNRDLLEEQLNATRTRFRVGELTKTDVAQAEARLARAVSGLTRAQAELEGSRALFREISGLMPGILNKPASLPEVPKTLDAALALGFQNSPALKEARLKAQAAEKNTDVVFGDFLPELNLEGGVSYSEDPQPGIYDRSSGSQIGIFARIPLYQAGSVRAQYRSAQHLSSQFQILSVNQGRVVQSQIITTWHAYQAANAERKSREAQVEASRIAREGVKAEQGLGTRTVLDMLDADQEYLDAQVSLVEAETLAISSVYALAASLGTISIPFQ